jgi:hypothetical protein
MRAYTGVVRRHGIHRTNDRILGDGTGQSQEDNKTSATKERHDGRDGIRIEN